MVAGMAQTKFRETLWFKRGAVEVGEEDAADDAPPEPSNTLPIEDRYLDDGTVAAEDSASFGLHTGTTVGMAPMPRPAGFADGMPEPDLVAEMKALPRTLLALCVAGAAAGVALLLAAGCTVEEFPEVGDESGPLDVSTPGALRIDTCNQKDYAGETWSTARSDHLVANYLPGTAAERDITDILARRETAYASIRSTLGVTAEPTFSVHLSPSRLAAAAHGLAYGRAWPGENRYQVIYTGAPGSYEMVRHGHELTHLIEYYIDPASARRLPILSEGLAEYLDQSNRDMHDAYAQQLLAGVETRVRVASFESSDVNGRNYGRAGSLVQFLIDRYGMAVFLDIFKRTSVTWSKGCWTSAVYGCIGTADALTAMLDGVLLAVTGEHWVDVQPEWEVEVQASLSSVRTHFPLADRKAVASLLATMDAAIANDDPALYRRTMESFYCEWGGESMREDIGARTVAAYGVTTTNLMRMYDTGVKNFTSARAIARRVDERGLVTVLNLSLERFPEGWKVTYGADWW